MIYLGTSSLSNNTDSLHFFYKDGMIYRVDISSRTSETYYSHWKHEVVSNNVDCEPFEYVLPETLNFVGTMVTDDFVADDISLYYELDDIITNKILESI